MPMTTPSTVNPLRSLFLASWRRDRTIRSTIFPAAGPLQARDEHLARLHVAGDEFRELPVHQADRDRDSRHLVPLLHPHNALGPGLCLFGPPLGGQFLFPLLRVLPGL